MGTARRTPWRILATSASRSWDIEEEAIRAADGEAEFMAIPCATDKELVAAAAQADGLVVRAD